jgi:hypothetical protein
VRIHACAVGVHPSGPLDEVSIEGHLALSRRLAWKEGLARALLIDADSPPRVECVFLLLHDSASAVGRVWTSTDREGRPGLMGLILHAEGAPVEWLCEQASPRLAAAAHMCRQTRSQQLVRLAVGELRSQLEDATALSVGPPRAATPLAQALQAVLASPAAHDQLALARRTLAPVASGAQRGAHASVQMEASPDATLFLRAWAHAARTLCPEASHVLALAHASAGATRLDLFVGDVNAASWAQALRDAASAAKATPARPSPTASPTASHGATHTSSAEESGQAAALVRQWIESAQREEPRRAKGASPSLSGAVATDARARPRDGAGSVSRRSVAILALGALGAIALAAYLLASRPKRPPQDHATFPLVSEGVRATPPSGARADDRGGVSAGGSARTATVEGSSPQSRANGDGNPLGAALDAAALTRGLPEPFARELARALRSLGSGDDRAESQGEALAARARVERAATSWTSLRAAQDAPLEPPLAHHIPLASDVDRAITSAWREHCDASANEVAEQASRPQSPSREAVGEGTGGEGGGGADSEDQPETPALERLRDEHERVRALRVAARTACVARSALARGHAPATEAGRSVREAMERSPPLVRASVAPLATVLLARLDKVAAIEALPSSERAREALRDAMTDTQGARDDEALAAWRVATIRASEPDWRAPAEFAGVAALLRPAIVRAGSAGRELRVGEVLRELWTREARSPGLLPEHADALLDAVEGVALSSSGQLLPPDERARVVESVLGQAGPSVQRSRSLRTLVASADASAEALAASVQRFLAEEVGWRRAAPRDPRVSEQLLERCRQAMIEDEARLLHPLIDDLGPAGAGWSVVRESIRTSEERGVESVEFASPGPSPVRVRFERTPLERSAQQAQAGAPQGRAFIATREASVALVAHVLATHAEREKLRALLWRFPADADPRQGPRAWEWTNSGGIAPAQRWARAQEESAPQAGPCAAPSGDTPMNYVSPEAARALADAMGCRLVSASEWSELLPASAVGATTAPEPAPEERAHETSAPNLRDVSWGAQASLFAKVGARALAPAGDICWPADAEPIATASDLAPATDTDDACAWFWPVDHGPRSGPFVNVIGNVAEWVAGPDGSVLVAGGSALSPAMVDRKAAVAIDPVRASRGYSDVGFRLAFDGGERVRPESAKSALRRALRDVQSATNPPNSQDQEPKP